MWDFCETVSDGLQDNGGQVGIYAEDRVNQGGAADWTAVGVPGNSPPFSTSFPWGRLQVLSPPSP